MYFNFIISDGTGNPSPPVSSSRAGKGKFNNDLSHFEYKKTRNNELICSMH